MNVSDDDIAWLLEKAEDAMVVEVTTIEADGSISNKVLRNDDQDQLLQALLLAGAHSATKHKIADELGEQMTPPVQGTVTALDREGNVRTLSNEDK